MHVTAGALLVRDGGEVMLIEHRAYGITLQPGGHLEATDTTLLGAALRELSEETESTPSWSSGPDQALCLLQRVPGGPRHLGLLDASNLCCGRREGIAGVQVVVGWLILRGPGRTWPNSTYAGCAGRGRAGYDAHAVGGVDVLVGHLALVAAPDAVAAHHHPDAAVLDGRRDRAPTINHDRFLL
ncbi:NUDIX domain-containing protein [Streptomyces goshikiensis]|uniref:NUDIX domain-containing protein n=1 Tax=Streptomyces goshikiensis TaxID=1942 RepID=UPI002E285D84|nr:NUDIX domain-containing protein [Streptomyces goshikiensis]